MNVCFKVNGKPQAKQRPRFANGHIYTPKQTTAYEQSIKNAYHRVAGSSSFDDKAVRISIEIHLIKTKSNKMKEPNIKPDIDNVIKSVMDGLNGVAYKDDKQVVEVRAIKSFAKSYEEPYIVVCIYDN